MRGSTNAEAHGWRWVGGAQKIVGRVSVGVSLHVLGSHEPDSLGAGRGVIVNCVSGQHMARRLRLGHAFITVQIVTSTKISSRQMQIDLLYENGRHEMASVRACAVPFALLPLGDIPVIGHICKYNEVFEALRGYPGYTDNCARSATR